VRKAAYVVIVILIVAVLFAWRQFNRGPLAFAGGSTVELADYKEANPTGVPASLIGVGLVKRGEYLARAADCMVCHTARGGQPYAGGLAIPLPFGTIFSTNITPDKDTGIGSYSDQDFVSAVRRGIRKDGRPLYPAMPYPSYTYLTDTDALAIKAYLFNLPPVHAANRPDTLAFPYNQRWTMAIWSFLFSGDIRFAPNTSRTAEWNRGAYIAEALAHCGECHTPRNLAFALDNRRKFAGAVTAGWEAYNITPDVGTGIGSWRDDEVFAYLERGHALGRGTAAGPMGEAVDESFSQMTPDDIHTLVTFLRSVPPIVSPDLPATLAPAAPASPKDGVVASNAPGQKIFAEACVGCHGWSGVSPLTPFATITGARAVNDPAATNVAQIVITGTRRTGPRGAMSMPAFGSIFSDAEIAAVVNYVTSRFGGVRSSVTENDIAGLRKEAAE
jgi:mono/diheme cytochrome c family protein